MSRAVKDGLGVHRHLAGWIPDTKLVAGTDRMLVANPMAAQPAAASLYPWQKQVPVFDQLQLGSCTANMGVSMCIDLMVKHGLPITMLSRMALYKFVRMLEGTPLTEDSGAQIRDIFTSLLKYGIPPEADDPYIDDGVQFTLPPTPKESADSLNHKALLYYRCPDLKSIKASILQGFSVGFGFTVYANMMTARCARTGIVLPPEQGEKVEGGHANKIVGYDDNFVVATGVTGAVRSRNSWSDGFGLEGDIMIPYFYFDHGLASDFWTLRMEQLP